MTNHIKYAIIMIIESREGSFLYANYKIIWELEEEILVDEILQQNEITEIEEKILKEEQEAFLAANTLRKKKILIVVSVALIISFVLYGIFGITPIIKYNGAIGDMKTEPYEAYKTFYEMGDYKDSIKQCKKLQWKNCKVGDTVYFGKYDQDAMADNGAEDVEWIVLAKKGGKALLISKYILKGKEYSKFTKNKKTSEYKVKNVYWATSDMREWLNGAFYKKVFTKSERAKIAKTAVANYDNSKYKTNAGVRTDDKLFLLSEGEVKKYFPEAEDRKADGTKAYKNQLSFSAKINSGTYNWWLRTPGKNGSYAMAVDKSGEINSVGYSATLLDDGDAGADGVRPAMWVKY